MSFDVNHKLDRFSRMGYISIMATNQTQIRINKDDRKNVATVKQIMRARNIPESDITQSSVFRFALEFTAKTGAAK